MHLITQGRTGACLGTAEALKRISQESPINALRANLYAADWKRDDENFHKLAKINPRRLNHPDTLLGGWS
jgi:hypothetical protein